MTRRAVNRRLLNFLTALSLLLCVAVVAIWMGSHLWPGLTIVDVGLEPRRYVAEAQDGMLVLAGEHTKDDTGAIFWWGLITRQLVVIPFWLLLLLTASIPAARGILGLGRYSRRYRAGHCRRCGYDLRATPERCPECGTAATGVTA